MALITQRLRVLAQALQVLPEEIRTRQVKGGGEPFFQALVRANMKYIRECLLDGALVNEGLLDRKKVDEYLVDDQVFRTVSAPQITTYLNAEIWLQQWLPAQTRAVA